MRGSLAKSSLQTGAMLGLRVATQAAVLVLLTRLLGPAAYGSFVAVASLAVVLGLLPNLGAGFVMLARRARDPNGVAAVWGYAWPMSVLLGLVLLLIFVVAAHFVTPSPLPSGVLLAIGAAELLLTPITMLFSFALQASDRVPRSQFVQWLPLGLRILAALPCFGVEVDQRLLVYVLLQLFASGLGAVLGYFACRPHVSLDWRPRMATPAEVREGASYAAMHLVAANPSELDKIVAARAVGPYDAGIYAATARVMSATVMPVTAMLLASQPRMFRHAHVPDQQGLRLIKVIAGLSFAWGTFAGVGLALCSPWLEWLFGRSFEATSMLMPWLSGAAPFLSLRLAAGAVLVAEGRPSQRITFELCGITVLVVAMLVMAPLCGIRGIAIALILAEASMAALGWWMVTRRLRTQLVGAAFRS